jgi:hypothetical protein
MQGLTKSHRVIAYSVFYPWLGIKRGKQDGWGAAGISGRVIFAACLGLDAQNKQQK